MRCTVRASQLQVGTVSFHTRKDFHFLICLLSARQFKMFLCHPLDESLVERLLSIQVIDEFLVVLDSMFVFAFANRKFREGCTIAQYQLRLEVLYQRRIRLAPSFHTVRLVDNQHGLGICNGIHRPMKLTQQLVVIVTGKQLTISDELRVEQKHIYLMLGVMRAIKEPPHGGGHVQTSLLLSFLRLQQAKFYLCVIIAHRLEMAFYLGFCQKRCCTSLDGQGRYGDDKLVEATTLVKFKHGTCVNVSLACTRLHLDVQDAMMRQSLDFLRQHVRRYPLLESFVFDMGLPTCKS